jgi:hypothetical protein
LGTDGFHNGINHLHIAALTEIGHAFDQRFRHSAKVKTKAPAAAEAFVFFVDG